VVFFRTEILFKRSEKYLLSIIRGFVLDFIGVLMTFLEWGSGGYGEKSKKLLTKTCKRGILLLVHQRNIFEANKRTLAIK